MVAVESKKEYTIKLTEMERAALLDLLTLASYYVQDLRVKQTGVVGDREQWNEKFLKFFGGL